MKRKILTMVLACMLMIGLLPIAGAADGAQSMANAALNYLERVSGPDLGFGSQNWCGYFLYRCAEDSGQTAALGGSSATMASTNSSMKWFINNAASVGCFYQAVIDTGRYGFSNGNLMNRSNYSPAVGDVIYYDWDGNPNGMGHMEVITTVSGRQITTVGGSTGSSCSGWNGVLHVHKHTYDVSSSYIVAYARPNYSGAAPVTPSASTLSINPTSEPGEHRDVGAPFYFRGSITSNYNVTSATIQVRSGDNAAVVMEKTVTPNKTNVDILKDGLDSLKFGSLGEGNYHLWLCAYDSSGNVAEWHVQFSVGYPDDSGSTPTQPPEVMPNCDNGHTFGAWKTVKEVTCGVEGQRERVCSVCGETETETIAALEHDYRVDGETDEAVYYVCANCGDNYTEEKKPSETGKGDFQNFTVQNRYNSGNFGDVKSGDWFYENVKATYELGLMKGTGSGTFSPGNNVTLAEAVTLAARIHSIYYTGSDSFASYDGGNWYDPYVDYARENNIINTYYNYSRPATREEFVHILAKALPEEALENIVGRISFADSGDITYMADVRLLSGAGVINGIQENSETYFKPLNTITRAEVAAVVGRMAKPETRIRK